MDAMAMLVYGTWDGVGCGDLFIGVVAGVVVQVMAHSWVAFRRSSPPQPGQPASEPPRPKRRIGF